MLAIVLLLLALASAVLAAARLDALARRVPGVWAAGQLVPIQATWFEDGGGGRLTEAAFVETTDGLRALLTPLSANVSASSWEQPHGRLVAVGVAEVDDPVATATSLADGAATSPGLQVLRAWAEGNRFVVVLGVSVPDPADADGFADRVSGQVMAAISVQRVLWYGGGVFATSIAALVAIVLGLGPALIAVLLLQRRIWRSRYEHRPPAEDIDPPPTLAAHAEVFDLNGERFANESVPQPKGIFSPAASMSEQMEGWTGVAEQTIVASRLASKRYNRTQLGGWGAAALFLMALAIPALTPTLWPESLFWAAVLGEWLLLGMMRSNSLGMMRRDWSPSARVRLALRMARWAVAALAVFALADHLIGLTSLRLVHSIWLVGLLAPITFATLLLYWRNSITDLYSPFDFRTSWRAVSYLVSALLFLLVASCLIFASNVDSFLRSALASKAIGLGILVVLVPIVVRRHRAADLASRRGSARAHGEAEVVLLRAFADDNLRIRSKRRFRNSLETMHYRRTEPFEDIVVRAFEGIGPVVAIAKPGTVQGEFGASRDRVAGEDWLTAVKAALRTSSFVVVILGPGEGLTAELRVLRDLGVLDRICLVVPPVEPSMAAARLAYVSDILDGPDGWGRVDTDSVAGGRVVALVGEGSRRIVVVWDPRRSQSRLESVDAFARPDSSEAIIRLGRWVRERRTALAAVGAGPTGEDPPA